MKNIVKQLGFILVAVVYCTAAITVTSLHTTTVANSTSTNTVQKKATSPTVTTNLFAYSIAAPENTANTLTNSPVPDLKITTQWSAATKITEQREGALFQQYTKSPTNFFSLYRKASIIFPFHYFW